MKYRENPFPPHCGTRGSHWSRVVSAPYWLCPKSTSKNLVIHETLDPIDLAQRILTRFT